MEIIKASHIGSTPLPSALLCKLRELSKDAEGYKEQIRQLQDYVDKLSVDTGIVSNEIKEEINNIKKVVEGFIKNTVATSIEIKLPDGENDTYLHRNESSNAIEWSHIPKADGVSKEEIDKINTRISSLHYSPIIFNTASISPSSAINGETVNSITVTWKLSKEPEALYSGVLDLPLGQSGSKSIPVSLTTAITYAISATEKDGNPTTGSKSVTSKFLSVKFLDAVYPISIQEIPHNGDSLIYNPSDAIPIPNNNIKELNKKVITLSGHGKPMYHGIAFPSSYKKDIAQIADAETGFSIGNTIINVNYTRGLHSAEYTLIITPNPFNEQSLRIDTI